MATDDPDPDDDDGQTLDSSFQTHRRARLGGKIEGVLMQAAAERDLTHNSGRFGTATHDGWPIIYGVATSGAHGWQVEDDDGVQRLAENAYAEDLSWLVFENGWIHAGNARWFRDEELAEWVRETQEKRDEIAESVDSDEEEFLDADDRIIPHEAYGREVAGWWEFEPTGYVGRPAAVVAFAAGYDARDADE